MTIASKFACFFPEPARTLGEKLALAGAVHIYRSSPTAVAAEVTSADFHEVGAAIVAKDLVLSCCCEQAEEGILCGHAWAVLLACDQHNELQKAATNAVRKSAYSNSAPQPQRPAVAKPRPAPPKSPLGAVSPPQSLLDAYQLPPVVDTDRGDRWRILYAIDWRASRSEDALVLSLHWQSARNGDWLPPQPFVYTAGECYPTVADTALVRFLATHAIQHDAASWRVKPQDEGQLLTELLATERLFIQLDRGQHPIPFTAEPEAVKLSFAFTEIQRGQFDLRNTMTATDGRVELERPSLLLESGHLLFADRLIALTPDQYFWLANTLYAPPIYPHARLARLASETQLGTGIPARAFPTQFQYRRNADGLIGKIHIRTALFKYRGKEQLHAELSFDYGGFVFEEHDRELRAADSGRRLLIERDTAAEEALRQQLRELGFRFQELGVREEYGWKLLPIDLPKAVEHLVNTDWQVTAEGKTYRKPTEKKAKVSYNMDWFELEGSVTFGDQKLSLPELIAVAGKGSQTILLDDGTHGVLPTEWLRNYTLLTEIGFTEGEVLKFSRGQYLLVDQLLKEQADLAKDERCLEQEAAIRAFKAIAAADAPASFVGALRDYQREGLGWMQQMATLQLGICLADDMGLGKTIQILALLADRAAQPHPSLVVLPKSLVFNWQSEAARFCPHLRVLVYAGAGRRQAARQFAQADIVLTTYGTVRRDVLRLKEYTFDYCILDESQAIKNFDSQSAKAVRLIQANHRICMTGTPIENNLAELLSQFEFMNPRLLGRLPALKDIGQATKVNEEQIAKLQRAIAPFFLRRTKKEVAKELPDKTVQVLYCDLNDSDRQRYDELKAFYQKEFLVEKDEKKAKKPIFQALLRLRQAASHPGLSNPRLLHESSAKQKLIRTRLRELIAEGHKVLIFSQFTSLLAIVQRDCEAMQMQYAYLDGQTQDRDAQVRLFQTNPDIKVFLISLKAGGVGLNLTAADYVFLLDPWWNPAIEAQAIDRAYRIGQQKHVFAYKVITRDTIEEKVLQLQSQKQDLAEAVFAEDAAAAIRSLTREDLEFLLG